MKVGQKVQQSGLTGVIAKVISWGSHGVTAVVVWENGAQSIIEAAK